MASADFKKDGSDHVENVDIEILKEDGIKNEAVGVMGTVKLTEGAIVYIPTPTADPRGKRDTSWPMKFANAFQIH